MHVQERFPQFHIPDGDAAEAPEKIDTSKVSAATPNLAVGLTLRQSVLLHHHQSITTGWGWPCLSKLVVS